MGGFPPPLWPTVFVFPLGLCFYYFILAGARTFEVSPDDDLGSGIAQFSFLVTGTLARCSSVTAPIFPRETLLPAGR